MEDGELPVVLGQGAGARTVTLPLPPFTLIGATTRAGLLTTPLRDRFGVSPPARALQPRAPRRDHRALGRHPRGRDRRRGGARRSPRRSRGTPRVANRLLKRVRDFAQVKGRGRDRRRGRRRRAGDARGRRRRPRPQRPRPARHGRDQVRRRPGRPLDPGGRDRRGAGHDRGRARALPAPAGPAEADSARPGAHPAGLRAPRPAGARGRERASSRARALSSLSGMPFFICPNCGNREAERATAPPGSAPARRAARNAASASSSSCSTTTTRRPTPPSSSATSRHG